MANGRVKVKLLALFYVKIKELFFQRTCIPANKEGHCF